jgi:hypothetical protein
MVEIISRRVGQLSGEASESNYEAGRYFVAGTDIDEYLDMLQRDVFAFVADQDNTVNVVFEVECGLENDLDLADVSGVARFVAFQATSAPVKPKTKKSSLSLSGQVIEESPGNFYVHDGKDHNFNAAAKRVVAEALDKYANAHNSVTINFDLFVTREDTQN